ncbi:RNA-binding protein [Limosilactobacillus mucosae]|uniref:YlmH family RNA-binding protein n=1 Tax=Lactobacillaceae TaxID=33958 RepID=UPI00146A1074|nr:MULTISPECIES: RNA-binding protein [Lactobacillaceae]MDD6454532.1 RNA-binding protein [Lactobacillus sp.]MDD6865611.1 RNA-binding protein [Lactobacillus sp.]MDM8220456.1 RNA-binding protein [Limosilactobacillus mucosae]MDM8315032.1 RNA-binding protein [Limosilactobacillus mucosae]NME34177.1 RNA-binding protein [Lactobacillus sp. MRS-253-APC-2B]
MTDEENIKQHFRPDEAPLIAQVEDWLNTAADQYRPVLTDFLNPRQVYIAQTLTNRRDDVKMRANGGWEKAEMQRILFYPSYYEPQTADFELQLIEIDYPTKFTELHHRQILGTLIGSGLERSAFGDVLNEGMRWQVVVSQSLVDYLRQQVSQIGKIHVKLKQADLETIVTPQEDWEKMVATVSSMRLDVLVAAGFNYSRNRAKQLVEHGDVRVNWETEMRPDYPLVAHDLLSIRHAGRIRIDEIQGNTRKNKIRVAMSVVHA